MNKKNRKNVVFSTDPDFQYEVEQEIEIETLPPNQQTLKIFIDRKSRKGKEATIIQGFVGRTEDLKKLGKKLRNACAVGGSEKNNEIIIQGNLRDKICDLLKKDGYRVKKIGG